MQLIVLSAGDRAADFHHEPRVWTELQVAFDGDDSWSADDLVIGWRIFVDRTPILVLAKCGGAAPHNILDGGSVHTDSNADTVTRGSIITGQGATPKWDELVIGSQYKVLQSDGTDVIFDWVRAHA